MDKYDSLERIAKLKQDGVLSEEEYLLEKRSILNGQPTINTQIGSTPPPMPAYAYSSPGAVGPNTKEVHVAVIVFGYILAFAFAIAGLALGIYTLNSGSPSQKGHGIAITVLSALSMFIAFLIIANR